MFDKEVILTQIFNISDEDYLDIENEDDYEVLTDNSQIAQYIGEGISYFVRGKVVFYSIDKSFKYVDQDGIEQPFINKDNYRDFVGLVQFLNGTQKEEKIDFKNERVKKKYKQMMKLKNRQSKSSEFELKDVLSVICNAEGNGINVFNVSKLTIYQAYEHFERLNIKENHKKTFALWANTFSLKEGTKLPEWITKTKM